jgi:hypothetical protein
MKQSNNLLQPTLNDVRDVFDLSASHPMTDPSKQKSLSVLSEMKRSTRMLQLRSTAMRDEFDLSASTNLIAPSFPILFPVLSEREMK